MWKNDICGIYKIENLVNGKVYIGQSAHIKQRWSEHKKELRRNKHANSYLQKSWNKYGEDNFSHVVLEECSEEELDERERYYIDLYDSFNSDNGYNLTDGGYANRNVSDSTRKKLSENMMGENHPNRKEVICLDTGEKYVSIVDAARSIGVDYSAITRCCNGITSTAKDLHWLFFEDYKNMSDEQIQEVLKRKNKQIRSVIYLNSNQCFSSIQEAHRITGVNANSISQCCLKNRKTAGKDENGNPRIFMYYDEYLEKVSQDA